MLILVGSFLALMLLGLPVAIAMAVSSLIYILATGIAPDVVLAQRMIAGVESFPLLAVPFFILAGNLMNTGGMTERIFRFATLQGESAAGKFGMPAGDPASWTVVLEDEHGVHERSDAALRIVSRLGGFHRFAALLLWVPKGIRDGVYRWIARNRYRWFGKRESCALPDKAERSLFLS